MNKFNYQNNTTNGSNPLVVVAVDHDADVVISQRGRGHVHTFLAGVNKLAGEGTIPSFTRKGNLVAKAGDLIGLVVNTRHDTQTGNPAMLKALAPWAVSESFISETEGRYVCSAYPCGCATSCKMAKRCQIAWK